MRQLFRLTFAACMMACLSSGEVGASSFLVVDHDRMMAESQAAEKVKREIEEKRKQFQAELDNFEKGLRQEEESLKAQETQLSEQVFTQKRLAFSGRVNMVHEKVSQRRAELEQAIQEARVQIVDKISDIVAQIAKEQRADVVLPKAGLVFSRPSLDVTDEALKRLNTQLPEVKITFKKQTELGVPKE
ncbi:MAG: OmpH family outer membrane protein [Proteobacteria bacterium]|nr:OmpH family outer membrane protein [Pseudomonadota bacterium]